MSPLVNASLQRRKYSSLIDSTATRNTGFAVSAVCPSSIANKTIVPNSCGSIQTNDGTCVLANNATRP